MWADTINKDAIKLTRVIVQKLAPRMMKEWEFHEIEETIKEAFKFLSNEPRVLIRVSEKAHEPIETEITRITSDAGFQGDIQVIGDQLINNGDCAISWDAGSLEKSLEETWSTIDKTNGMPYAIYIRAGHDGTGTEVNIKRIITGLKWKEVQKPLILKGGWNDNFKSQCFSLGATIAAGLDANIY